MRKQFFYLIIVVAQCKHQIGFCMSLSGSDVALASIQTNRYGAMELRTNTVAMDIYVVQQRRF